MKAIIRNKWFLAMIAVLLLSNIALLLSFFVIGERDQTMTPEKKAKESASKTIYRQLRLDESQEKQFTQMKEAHFERMRPIWHRIRDAKRNYFLNLRQPDISQEVLDSMWQEVAVSSRISDSMSFRHFQELRKLCTPDQQLVFDTLIPSMMADRWHRSKSK